MNFTSRLAMLLAGSTVLIGLNTVPASAAPQPPVQAPERAAEWTWTTSTGGPIRECYSAGCAPVIGMAPGVQVQWSHYACNSSGKPLVLRTLPGHVALGPRMDPLRQRDGRPLRPAGHPEIRAPSAVPERPGPARSRPPAQVQKYHDEGNTMRTSRLLACTATMILGLAGAVSTANAASSTDTPTDRRAASFTHAAPTMTYCVLNVRASPSSSSTNLQTLHNRNGSCPGGSGYDTIPCWDTNCGGHVTGGTYTCSSGSAQHHTWTPVDHNGTKAWIAHACAGYQGP